MLQHWLVVACLGLNQSFAATQRPRGSNAYWSVGDGSWCRHWIRGLLSWWNHVCFILVPFVHSFLGLNLMVSPWWLQSVLFVLVPDLLWFHPASQPLWRYGHCTSLRTLHLSWAFCPFGPSQGEHIKFEPLALLWDDWWCKEHVLPTVLLSFVRSCSVGCWAESSWLACGLPASWEITMITSICEVHMASIDHPIVGDLTYGSKLLGLRIKCPSLIFFPHAQLRGVIPSSFPTVIGYFCTAHGRIGWTWLNTINSSICCSIFSIFS